MDRPTPRIDRRADRRLAVAGSLVGAGALVGALVLALVPGGAPSRAWAPLHLALALGAATAIAAVLPFFATSLAAAPASSRLVRVGSVAAVTAGAGIAIVAVPAGAWTVAALGACLFAAGIALVGWASFGPLRWRRRAIDRPVYVAYAVGLADVVAGVLLVAGGLLGWPPVATAWPAMRAAHAWLNVFGFISLVIAGTLLHLLPTIVGGRIQPGGRWRSIAVAGLVPAAPLVALGMMTGADALAIVGVLAALVGALGLFASALLALRARGRWTTDAGWHRSAVGLLTSAVGWFVVAVVLAAGPILDLGADPAAWSLDRVLAPLVVGWVGLAVLGSATHLVPSIGPGGPAAHGRQRMILGRWSWARLLALDAGTALLAVGLPARALGGEAVADVAPAIGWALVVTGAGLTLALLLAAAVDGLRGERS